MTCIRNQVIIAEDTKPTDVYIIIKGEFRMTKKVPEKLDASMDAIKAMIGPDRSTLKVKHWDPNEEVGDEISA
jgi:hypothetical protein